MGARGPIPNPRSRRSEVRKAAGKGSSLTPRPSVALLHPATPPEPPASLSAAGVAVWRDAWRLPWMHESDRSALTHLCRLEDERAAFMDAVEADGALLSEPLSSARGDVIGERRYAHPLLAEVHRRDATIGTLRDRLGLSPMARARLGQAVVVALKSEIEKERILAKYREAAEGGKP